MNRALHGSCHVPVAALATLDGETVALHGLVGDASNGECLRASGEGRDPQAVGEHVARALLDAGAGTMLAG